MTFPNSAIKPQIAYQFARRLVESQDIRSTVEHIPPSLTPLLLSFNNMFYQYRDIVYQNLAMRDDLQELVKPLEDSIADIKEIYKYIADQQIKNFYDKIL